MPQFYSAAFGSGVAVFLALSRADIRSIKAVKAGRAFNISLDSGQASK